MVDPVTPGRIWIGGSHGYGSPLLLLSSDSGQTWTDLSAGLAGGNRVSALLVDPDHGATIYAAVFGPNALDSGPRLFRSDDAGQNWQRTGAGLSAASLAISPKLQITSMILQRGLLYASLGLTTPIFAERLGGLGGIFVSPDRGANWSDISGATGHPDVSQLIASDPIIAATYGEGIFVQTLGRQRIMHP